MMRFLVLVVVLIGLYVVASATGVVDELSAERLQELLQGAGVQGVLLFVAAFSLGLLIQIPGVLFVGVAAVAYGSVLGAVIGLLAGLFALSVTFFVVRGVAASPLAESRWPWIQRLLTRLDARPIRTVALLRLVLFMSPPINYALAMSRVRYSRYILGSALGLLAPVAIAAALFGQVG